MKKKIPRIEFEELIPLLISCWRRLHKLPGPSDRLQTREFRSVVESVKKLKTYFASNQKTSVDDYFSNPDLLGAYLLYFWILRMQEGLSILNEIPRPFRRVLDLCSGPGAFAFAALAHGAGEVIAVDQNQAALNLAAEICGRFGFPLITKKWQATGRLAVEGKFDVIILGYCLDELFCTEDEKQHLFLIDLLKYKLNPDGFLVIVDNSSLETNHRILRLRDQLVKEGIPIQAPCVWQGECPALKTPNSPCYAQRDYEKPFIIKEIQRAAEINQNSLKMSYLITRGSEAGWPKVEKQDLFRIISPPIDSFTGKKYYLCGTRGKRTLASTLENFSKDARAFEYLKRGELISIEGAYEQQNHLDVVQDTRIKVIAAVGKALPEKFEDNVG